MGTALTADKGDGSYRPGSFPDLLIRVTTGTIRTVPSVIISR